MTTSNCVVCGYRDSLPPEERATWDEDFRYTKRDGALVVVGRTPDGQTVWADQYTELREHFKKH